MKYIILPLCLLGVVLASPCKTAAQAPSFPVREGITNQAGVPVYTSITDTLKANTYLAKSNKVTVVSQELNGRWSVIQRGKNQYYLLTRYLTLGPEAAVLPSDPITGLISFSEVVQAPGVAQQELYTRGKVWFINHFKDSRHVLSTQEKEAGLMIGRGWTTMPYTLLGLPANTQLWYTVRLSFKEGRYKYEITELATKQAPSRSIPNPTESPLENYRITGDKPSVLGYKSRQEYLTNAASAAENVAHSIKTALSQPATGDW